MTFAFLHALFRHSPLPHFVPSDVIKLGDAEIDEQHNRMFLLAKAVVESINVPGLPKVGSDVAKGLQDLIDFSLQHFRFEEDLMSSARYPGAAQHAKEHSRLLEELARHRYQIELGHPNVAEITRFFRDWINRHIDKEDRELVLWLKVLRPDQH